MDMIRRREVYSFETDTRTFILDNTKVMSNNNMMTLDGDDVMSKYSYGWLFSAVTAFGLLLFLAFSFALFHRRIMIRRRKEAEYRRFFKSLRPDLDVPHNKRIRPRLTVTTSNTFDTYLSYKEGKTDQYNEAVRDNSADPVKNNYENNENKKQISYARLTVRQQKDDFNVNMQPGLCNKCMTHVHLIKQDSLQSEKVGESYTDNINTKKHLADSFREVHEGKQLQISKYTDKGIDNHYKSTPNMNQNDRTNVLKTRDDFTEKNTQHSQEIKSITALKQKPVKRKKKKRGLLSRISNTRNTTSLVEGNINTAFYCGESRRCAEAFVVLCNEDTADPVDAKRVTNQSKQTFNPYYTDIDMPIKRIKKGKARTVENGNEIDIYKECNYNYRETSLPANYSAKPHMITNSWM